MHFSTSVYALVAGLLATSAAAADLPFANVLARATPAPNVLAARDHDSDCSKSLVALTTKFPTPKDKSLSSWLNAHTATTTTYQVPPSLQAAYCTYESSAVHFVSHTVLSLASSCSDYLGATAYSVLTEGAKSYTTTETWCSSVTHNWAPARETGYVGGALAAAGLVAAVL